VGVDAGSGLKSGSVASVEHLAAVWRAGCSRAPSWLATLLHPLSLSGRASGLYSSHMADRSLAVLLQRGDSFSQPALIFSLCNFPAVVAPQNLTVFAPLAHPTNAASEPTLPESALSLSLNSQTSPVLLPIPTRM
jgi:hypothetical protein